MLSARMLLAGSFAAALIVLPLGTSHATVYVIARSRNFIVVSMDTRQSRGGDSIVNDTTCKIIPLDNKTIFFMSGQIGFSYDETGNLADKINRSGVNLNAAASQAFSYEAGSINTQRLALRWASYVAKEYNNAGIFRQKDADPVIADGNFAGGDGDDSMKVYQISVFEEKPETPHTFMYSYPKEIVNYKEGRITYGASAHGDIVDEIFGSTTERAKQLISATEKNYGVASINTGEPDGLALASVIAVQSVINWGNDLGIGGQVATIILERDKPTRWFRQPWFCPPVPNSVNFPLDNK